jgi:predicted RNase H-like HicB family nuclease
MATIYYPAIIERASKGYSVFFPDLPGCTSAGRTVTEAAVNAEEALAGHLLVSEQHGDALAHPSELDAIGHDPEARPSGSTSLWTKVCWQRSTRSRRTGLGFWRTRLGWRWRRVAGSRRFDPRRNEWLGTTTTF